MKRTLAAALAILITLLLGACAPQAAGTAQPPSTTITLETPEAVATNRAALEAWHLMELARLQTGEYTTNALVDLSLPQGVQWRVESFSGDEYALRFTSSNVSELEWLVTPQGVSATRVTGDQSS